MFPCLVKVLLATVQLLHLKLYLILQTIVQFIDLLLALSLFLFFFEYLLGPYYFDVSFDFVVMLKDLKPLLHTEVLLEVALLYVLEDAVVQLSYLLQELLSLLILY